MGKFDDIPIKELNKTEAYQQQVNQETALDEVMDEDKLPLIEKMEHPKWKVRLRSYKEVSEIFYNEYSKDCIKQKHDSNLGEEEEHDRVSPFEQFTPVL